MATNCPICNTVTSKLIGGVFEGEYRSPRCESCLGSRPREKVLNLAEYNRERDREKNARDIIQPYWKGKPNREFLKAYPKKSRDYFTDKEIKDTESSSENGSR